MKEEVFINSDPGFGNVAPGTICAANEGRFNSEFYSEPLTTFGVGGWDHDNLQLLLDFLAPAVPVSRRFSYKLFDIANEFIADNGNEDARAIGADFTHVDEGNKTEENGKTSNRGLTTSVDADELEDDPQIDNTKVKKLTNRLLRNEIRRAIAALKAASVSTNKTWGSAADPDMDVSQELLTGLNATGLRANRVLYGSTAWTLRELAFRAQNTAGSNASAAKTIDQVGAYLAAATMKADALYRNANTAALAAFLAGTVLMFNASDGLSSEDPSNIKRFVTRPGGQVIRIYRQQVSAKRAEISVEHYSLIKVTSVLGIRKFEAS